MKGVLLINMGSPTSLNEMRQFLFKMFMDPAILPFAKIPRTLLASTISIFRHYGSWQKYKLIGGSPLKAAMNAITKELQEEMGSDYLVQVAYSYSRPLIKQGIHGLEKAGVSEIIVLPMYPHSAISTTGSIANELKAITAKIPITMLGKYGVQENFINYWVELIQKSIAEYGYKKPTLLFSAHAIPYYQIENGDTYEKEINASASLISSRMGLEHRVAFQSKIGRVKWLGPDTKDCLRTMKNEGIDEILLVPISFINENLETLYDQGIEIVPFGYNTLVIKHIWRVPIPLSHPLLIKAFKEILLSDNSKTENICIYNE